MYEELLNRVSDQAKKMQTSSPDDYMRDGLLHCGTCHGRKQTRINVCGREMVVNCICRCQKETLERERKAAALYDRVRALRREAFDCDALRDCTFARDSSPDSFLSRVCRNFADRFDEMGHKGLLLFGDVGTGKSFYAACIANALIDRGIACRMTTLSALAKEKEIPDRYRVVILDDFGTERDTEYMREAVWSIIDTLYRKRITLICTTNLTSEELKTAADTHQKRILSRLYEMCMFYAVEGVDRRRAQMKADNAPYKAILESAS